MSCVSAWQQFSRQPVMVTLNLRGRLVNSLLSRMSRVELVDDRRGVEQLVRRQAGHRAAADAADVVHAGLLAVQADLVQPPPDVRHVGEREPAQLNLLPRGQVAEALAVLVGQVGDDAELAGVGLARVRARTRSMKLPGVGLRKNRPCHLARCLSSSVISCPVVVRRRAAGCRAGSRGRPSPPS